MLAVCILALFLWLLPQFAAISENLYFRLNNSLERDNHFIRKGDRRQLYRHYGLVARLRVLISNREAFGYLCVGAAMSILLGFAFVMMTLKGYGSAGHVYSVSTYLWMFEFGRRAAIGRTIFKFERHRTTDRGIGTEHQSWNLKNAV